MTGKNIDVGSAPRSALRRTVLLIVFSCLLGVLVGTGAALAALTINGWNPELELKKHADWMAEAAARISNPNAKASIENTVYNFGIKDVKEKGRHDFVIKNVGTAALTLEVNQTTCSCTGIDLSSKRVRPGDSAIATVHYNAERATPGAFNQGGTILTNDPENREIYLAITGIFTSPIVASSQPVLFPSIPASETRSAVVRFYGFEKKPLVIESAEWKDREHFDIQLRPAELSDSDRDNSTFQHAGSVYEAEVTVKPGLPLGAFQERFYLRTNYAGEPTFDLLIRGQISGGSISIAGSRYYKETGTLAMGTTMRGRALSQEIMIRFAGLASLQANLRVREVKPDWLKTTLTDPRDLGAESSRHRFYALTVEVPADAPACNYTKSDEGSIAMITLETGLEETPTLKIPVQFAVEQ